MQLRTIYLFALIGITILLISACNSNDQWQITSPNKSIKIEITQNDLDSTNQLFYSIYLLQNNVYTQVVLPSPLGIEREKSMFIDELKFLSSNYSENLTVDYQLISGSKKDYKNTYNQINLEFKNNNKQKMILAFRAFDNGVAFHYKLPEGDKVTAELTGFNLAAGNFWAHPYDTITQWSPSYETYYTDQLKIGTNAPADKRGWAFPMLFETNNCWIHISEAGFDGTYSASHISGNCIDKIYRIKFAEPDEAMGLYSNSSLEKLPNGTPWRVITIGNTLAEITESHLVTDVALPNKLEDTEWIKPGRASWSWWSESESPTDYNRLAYFVDFAAEMGWEYSLVDANWNKMENGSLDDLSAYAETKGVGLLIWYNSGGKHNVVPEEPRDLMHDREVRRREFERINKIGIKGIKVDFFQSDKQQIINQYIEILEDAAEFHLLVNFHGCTLPKGWRRTYPNLLTQEAIRGAESYKFDRLFPEKAPAHLATVPFLRGVSGPTDYTPGGFSNHRYPHLTTLGYELALPIIIESGIIHYTEYPEMLKTLPPFVTDILKEIPAKWDDIKFISGYPGEDAVIARKKLNKWYIGGINGENKEKNIQLDLTSIAQLKSEITIITDSYDMSTLYKENKVLSNGKIAINTKPYGGFVCIINNESN